MQTMPVTSATLPSAQLEALYAVMNGLAREIDTAAHVTLALPHHDEPWTALWTDPTGEALTEIEQTAGGPALDSLWSGHIVRISSTLSHAHWPEYIEACKHHGVGSVIAFPVSMDRSRVGVMTVAWKDYYAFGPDEISIGVRAATRAAEILTALRTTSRIRA